jgi:hypothetical protein
MNGRDDLSHVLSEYFGTCRKWRPPRRGQQCPGSNPKGYSLPVKAVTCSGSAAAIPVPPFGLVPAEAARNLVPAVLGSEFGKWAQ